MTLTREDLFSLEKYSAIKTDYRAKVMEIGRAHV